MAFTPGDPNQDLIALTEMELGHRIDGDTWVQYATDLFIADKENHRIHKRDRDTLAYKDKVGSYGNGDAQFAYPSDVATDGVYFYVVDTNNHRLKKYLCSDMSLVALTPWDDTGGSGDDEFAYPIAIACFAGYLYISDNGNSRIKKHLCSDLSYVAKIGTEGAGDNQFHNPRGICTDGIYLYILDGDNFRIKKHLCSDLSYVVQAAYPNYNSRNAITTDGTNLFVTDANGHKIEKYLCSDLSFVSDYGSYGSGDTQFDSPMGIEVCGAHLYVSDNNMNDRIKMHHKSDFSYESKIGSRGTGNDQFTIIYGNTVVYYSCWFIYHPEGEPSKVEANGLELTKKTSLMECHIDNNSWFYEPGSKRLYLHTSGSDDPGNGSYVIVAYFWEYIASEVIYLDGHEYLPYLRREDLPALNYSTGGYHEGGTRQAFGSIKWINTDGYFDARLSAYIYEAKKMLIKLGRRGAAYADYLTYFVCLTGNIRWSDSDVEVDIEDLRI
jgi:hypothetical protein